MLKKELFSITLTIQWENIVTWSKQTIKELGFELLYGTKLPTILQADDYLKCNLCIQQLLGPKVMKM